MTIYVDDGYRTRMGAYRRMKMSHMLADDPVELHQMAARLGMRREWFHKDHYDVSITRRQQALAMGAVAITLREAVAVRRALRSKLAKEKSE